MRLIDADALIERLKTSSPDPEGVDDWIAIIDELPSVDPQPCDDAISRAQALSDYADWFGYGYRDNTFYKHLKDMPSIQPKTGYWISHHHGCEYECSECHDMQRAKSKYCPNCSARMVEPQEGSGEE